MKQLISFASRLASRKKAASPVRLRFVAALAAAMLLPVAICVWLAFETRATALAGAQDDERQVTETLAEHTLKLLEAQALALGLVDSIAGERDCPALRADGQTENLMRLAAQSPQTKALWIINADGVICMVSDPARMDSRSWAFREYFIGARDAPPGRFYVDRAITALVDAVPNFNVSKARVKNGAFNGIVNASVSLTELVQYWQKVIGASPTQRIGLFRTDGATIARSWLPLVPAPNLAVEQRLAATWQTRPDGTAVRLSALDGMPRVSAWRSLPDWGVVVTSSIGQEAVLAPWRRSTILAGFVALVISGLLGALTWSLQKRVDSALEEAEARFRGIFNSQFQFIGLLAPNGVMLEANKTALDAAGLRLNDVVGQPFWETAWWPAEERDCIRRDLANAAQGALVRREAACIGKDGATIWLDFSLNPVRDPATKEVIWIIAEGRDLTEKRALADKLAQAQKVEALGQLAGGIAHDFNNILQAISAAATLIDRDPVDLNRTRRLARATIDAAARGTSITRRLLSFARRAEIRAEVLAIAEVLANIREVLTHTLGSAISVQYITSPSVPNVMADRGQLETALLNLGTNARDAMPDGGTLSFFAEAEQVAEADTHPAKLAPGNYVRLSVTDTGTGMNPATIAKATEPFFTTKPVGQGTGLGLPMVKDFAEQSGGRLLITSSLGRGTTVALWLRQANAAIAQTPGHDKKSSPSRSIRILVVDDDDLVRETLAALLDDQGFEALVATNGAEAIALIEAGERVDAMVSDLSMPGIDGVMTIQKVRALRPNLPCFLLTGYAGESAALSAADTFTLIRKPVSAQVLIGHIEAGLEAASQNKNMQVKV